MAYKICEEVEILQKNYDDPIQILDGLPHHQKKVIEMTEFYGNSRYLNGQVDELGRPKAYYQVLNGMCDVEDAAKDIDTKDITVVSDNPNKYYLSFLLSKDIYQWMAREDFGKTLNDMKKTHTRYGSLLVKKVIEKDEDGKKNICIEIQNWIRRVPQNIILGKFTQKKECKNSNIIFRSGS